MLLNYLYTHYYERAEFCALAKIDDAYLTQLETKNLVAKPSYILRIDLSAESFITAHKERALYKFYAKNQLNWLAQINTKQIKTEMVARQLFDQKYDEAIKRFLATDLGMEITKIYPQSDWGLSEYAETWQQFTDGTYGLCTRTGLPNEIFLKHIYIRFIEFITAAYQPDKIPPKTLKLLSKAVEALDVVEADFAPHEVKQSSRQRCIVNVKKEYFK